MKKNSSIVLQVILSFCLMFFFSSSFAQSKSLWKTTSEDIHKFDKVFENPDSPESFSLFELQAQEIKELLETTSSRKTSTFDSGTILGFPNADGSIENYRVLEASVMHPDLQERYPEIRSYKGQSITNPANIIRFSISPRGLSSVKLSPSGVEYIEPYALNSNVHAVYRLKDVTYESFVCETEALEFDTNRFSEDTEVQRNSDDGQLREFILAMACTEEYANFHINQAGAGMATDAEKIAVVLAEMNDVMTRVNAVYENELSLTMTLVSTNDDLIFLSSPFFSNNNLSMLINESQTVIDSNVGVVYDIGHTVCTGPGGLAQLFSPCTANKARGVTGTGSPSGVQFEGILMHEMGHQYGSPHTFNGNAGACNGNRTEQTAYEPGSGTTIMGYAGICGSQNIQTERDLYFHQISLQFMWDNITIGNSTCASQTPNGNSPSTAEAGASYNIPIRTPYKLTGTSTDADGTGTHTYCWEQYDLGPAGIPSETTLQGPLVRSFPPSDSPTRYIPRLEDVVSNGGLSTEWEKLSLLPRDINFRFTVRDNDPAGGQNSVDFMTVSVISSGGFFRVTSQNTGGIIYDGNSTQTVTWDVAGTTDSPINASNVNILLSTDGGVTFDTVLAANTPNDGSQDVQMPNVDSPNCRIIVEAVGNIFYNINLSEFEIVAQLSVEDFLLSNLSIYPNPNRGDFTIEFRPNTSNDITIDLYDIRGRKVFSNDYQLAGDFNENISLNNTMAGLYILNISDGTRSIERKLIIQ